MSFVKEIHSYKTVGDCNIQLDVYRNADERIRPAIFWIHGGALIVGNRGALPADQRDRYLEAGYTVISIDYRLAPESKLAAIIEDLQDAYRWVRLRGPSLLHSDPDRIAVIGHSAGGYLTLMAGFCLDPRPQALVSFYGYGDIAAEWYSRPDPFYCQQPAVTTSEAYAAIGSTVVAQSSPGPRGRFYLYCRQKGLWPQEVAGYDPEREPAAFGPLCPVRNVTAHYPPTMLLHGDQDTDVPYAQSVQMAQVLERQGVAHRLVTLPNKGHGFDHEPTDPIVAAAFVQVLAFLQKYLAPDHSASE